MATLVRECHFRCVLLTANRRKIEPVIPEVSQKLSGISLMFLCAGKVEDETDCYGGPG